MDFSLPGKAAFIRTAPTIPRHLNKYKITGAQSRYKLFREGYLLTQVIAGNDYSIWVHYFFIQEPVRLLPSSNADTITLHYMMQGNINSYLEGFGPILLEEGKYHFFYIPGNMEHEARFSPGFYLCFHVDFHPVHFKVIVGQYPVFQPMLAKAERHAKNGSSHEPYGITTNIRRQLYEILHNSLPAMERTLFLDAAIRNLLRLYISDLSAKASHETTIDERLQLLINVEAYIESHLDKSLSVDRIASKFNLSRSRLQYICSDHFKIGIHQLVRKKRMEAAASLLLETRYPVGTIVIMVSDMTFSAFTASFREYYGQPPLEFRKNKGHNR